MNQDCGSESGCYPSLKMPESGSRDKEKEEKVKALFDEYEYWQSFNTDPDPKKYEEK